KQRAAELKDEQLYSQGLERPEGDFCPICTLPIPLPMENHSIFKNCCMKLICHGCSVAAQKRGMSNCAFCRAPPTDNDTDALARIQARVLKKDPAAIYHLGGNYWGGKHGLQNDFRKAVKLWTEAAELGSIDALYNLGVAYESGEGVEKNRAKATEFYKGRPCRDMLRAGTILAILRDKRGTMFMAGIATKEQYAEALKGYQDAVEEMRSHDRDEAKRLRDGRCSYSTNLSNLPALFLDLRTHVCSSSVISRASRGGPQREDVPTPRTTERTESSRPAHPSDSLRRPADVKKDHRGYVERLVLKGVYPDGDARRPARPAELAAGPLAPGKKIPPGDERRPPSQRPAVFPLRSLLTSPSGDGAARPPVSLCQISTSSGPRTTHSSSRTRSPAAARSFTSLIALRGRPGSLCSTLSSPGSLGPFALRARSAVHPPERRPATRPTRPPGRQSEPEGRAAQSAGGKGGARGT
ncbi:hypothetical protein THAOC_15081, partial [Thalassiosira oceanica]